MTVEIICPHCNFTKEMPVEKIVMRYGIGSGDIRRVVDTATWLISALIEISELKQREDKRYRIYAKKAKSLSERVAYGIKKDAVSLTRVKGIGRKRARVLLEHGIRDLTQLSSKNAVELSKIPGIGTELAKIILDAASRATLEEEQEGESYRNGDIAKYMS